MNINIPKNYIKRCYVRPRTEAELYLEVTSSLWWRLMEGHSYVMLGFLVIGAVILNLTPVSGSVKGSVIFGYSFVGLFALFSVIAVKIVFVEWSEAKSKNPYENVTSVCFDLKGVSIEMSAESEQLAHQLPIAGIKSVSGYIQNGWFWTRDRGVVIESNDGGQFRFAMSLNKSELSDYLNGFTLSLVELGYPTRSLINFQV